jgi:hypothetical protein
MIMFFDFVDFMQALLQQYCYPSGLA